MSQTPPISSATRASEDEAGDGMRLTAVKARGAQPRGAIWILVISLALAVVALGAFWLIQSPRMAAVNHPSGQNLNTQDVRKLYTPPTSPPTAGPTINAMTGG